MVIPSTALYDYLSVDLHYYLNGGGTSLQQFASQVLMKTALKKFQDEVDTDITDAVALAKFQAMNIRCSEWSYKPGDMLDEYLLGAFEQRFHEFFSHDMFGSDLETLMSHGRFGPGASVGANGYDFFTKIGSGPLTATSYGIYRAYDNYVSTIPNWRVAELIREISYGQVNVVEGSVLGFVPKNNTTSRIICTEPALNMFAQLGMGALIEKRLKSLYNIDLSHQPEVNAELARLGSIDGSFFTIDLESASDTISLRMLERFMPPAALSMLKALRCAVTRLPNGELLPLNMVSSMGNGFTFPLQTAIFVCALRACFDVDGSVAMRYSGDRLDRIPGNFGVFGDDIVGPSVLYDKAARLLSLLGFIVNSEKSFSTGLFRESCGADYLAGSNVRGVYIKSLNTHGSRYVAINRLNAWSAEHGIPLTYTIGFLCRYVHFKPVPLHEADDSGVKLPLTLIRHRVKRVSIDSVDLWVYRKYVNRDRSMRTLETGEVISPKGAKKRIYNPAALLTAFLGGYVRDGRIMLRQLDASLPGTRKCRTPHWDFIQQKEQRFQEPVKQQVLYRRLVTASVLNFVCYLK